MKKQRRSKEEVFLAKLEKAEEREAKLLEKELKKQLREAKRSEKKAPRERKEPTESELVHRYVRKTMQNQKYHNRGIEEYKINTKTLWRDIDFYFSVVFQHSSQRDQFLEALKIVSPETHAGGSIKIVNGLKFAEALGIKLERIEAKDYPLPNLDLLPNILDDEEVILQGDSNGEKES